MTIFYPDVSNHQGAMSIAGALNTDVSNTLFYPTLTLAWESN